MGITGAALVALGIICICNPMSTVISLAWLLGILTLVSGAATLLNWISLRSYFPQSGSILLSAVLQIIIGILLFVGAWTNNNPVDEVKKTVKKVKNRRNKKK